MIEVVKQRKALEQEPCEDCVSRKSLLDKLDPLYKEKIKTAPDNMAEGFLQVSNLIKYEPPVTPKGVTVTEFADKCRECGREKVLDKIKAEIAQSYCTVNNDYDHGRNYGLYMATQIIDKYKAESE